MWMILSRPFRVSVWTAFFLFFLTLMASATAQTSASPSMPNECCPQAGVVFAPDRNDASSIIHDAGSGKTVVTTYGAAEREILMPVVEDGMMGLATLYHRWLKVDASYSAWDGSGTSLEGGSIPTPNMDAANLATDPDDGAWKVQPRPGTMPGLYLYYDNTEGAYYHYGGPIDSGASPQSTAIYKLEEGGGGGGMFAPAFLGPWATTIYTNNLSGAQLWHYGGATVPYIEIKHVDGTVARFDSFDPYKAGYSPSGVLWRVTSVRDPYDNAATYTYTGNHRLEQIEFPSGYIQKFNYNPGWSGWSGIGADLLEITYERKVPSQANLVLPLRTWGVAFMGTLGTSGGRHFGKRLYRTYSATRRVLHDPPSSAPYTWSSDPYVDGQIVHELSYDTTNRILLETQSVHTGTAFAATLSGSGLSTVQVLETRYVTSGGNAGRVLSQEVPLTGEAFECTYPSATRTTDLLSQSVGNLRAIAVEAADGTVRQFEYDYEHGYVYRIVTTPTTDFDGSPRSNHASSENSGIGGVATTDIEPESITIDNVFDGSCVCQKPVEVRRIARRGSTDYTRITNYEYFTGTKLLKKRSEPNPETGSSVPAQVHWQYTYVQAKTTGQAWGAWLPDTEVTPDGTYVYSYLAWQNRSDATNHGQMPAVTQRSLSGVRIQGSLIGSPTVSTTDVVETLARNVSSDPWSLGYFGNVQGQPRLVIDPDGVSSLYEYSTQGWLTKATMMSGQVETNYGHDSYGQVETVTENAASTAHVATTTYTLMSGVGIPREQTTTGPSSTLLSKSGQFFDRFGHLGVERRWNRDSAGNKPTNHAGTTTSARDWVEDQYHYLHRRLIATYRDRLPLDLPAGTGQFMKTELFYDSLARLDYVVNPNGSHTFYDFDGYGTLYRTLTKDPTLSTTVTGPKQFINPFLEVAGSYEYAGIGADGSTPDHLWTLIERNGAGAVTRVTEPKTVAPANYATPSGGGVFSTGGARHDFSLDTLGRVTKADTYEIVGSTTLLLASREMRYDQLSRQIWQHDDARLRDIDATSTSSTGDQYVAWKYKAGSAAQLDSVERTGAAATTYEYHASGLLKKITDGFSTGNQAEYAYHSNTPFLSLITRTDLDVGSGTRVTTTAYDADPLGRTTAIKEGSPQLVHAYAYNKLGGVDRYTDPMSRVQKFLPDAMGRIVEHVRVGAGSDFIRNASVFDDSGASDGRTKVTRTDHLDHTTITHYDFAGRPFIVQNPGAVVSSPPTGTSPNQAMSLYAEYDSASRIKYVYQGNAGRTEFFRDGMGRVIQQRLAGPGGGTTGLDVDTFSLYNTMDFYRRDAMGRIAQIDYWGADYTLLWAVGITEPDSTGRTHSERFYFAGAPGNPLDIVSSYSGGSPYRSGLDYLDTLTGSAASRTQPLRMQFDHDAIGRLEAMDWDRASGGSGFSTLAEYGWVGGLRRSRSVAYESTGAKHGETAFAYDAYGRLTGIEDDVWTSATPPSAPTSAFEYEYDAASNLIKEKYLKVGGGSGDRFAYDAYHRLTKAWMGVNSTTMAATGDPTGFSSSTMDEEIRYTLDGANNRDEVSSETAGGVLTTKYDLQSTTPQGPSNRYVTIDEGAGPVGQEYDNRGNLTFDGRFYYRYDYRNRLQEVFRIELSQSNQMMQSSSAETSATTASATSPSQRFVLVNPEGLKQACRQIRTAVPDLMDRAITENQDPQLRAKLRAPIPGGVLRLGPPARTGGGMMGPIVEGATAVLTAVYVYDSYNRRTITIPWEAPVTTQFHTYDGWRQVGQYGLGHDGTNFTAEPNKQFVWGSRLDELISYRRLNGTTWENYFVLHGGQDTAAKLVDDEGNVVEQYEYDPYGKVTVYDGAGSLVGDGSKSGVGLPFLWKGIRLDSETGLLYMRNRYYSVGTGRFLTRDVLGTWADQLNYGCDYGYVGNRPLVAGDWYGLQGGLTFSINAYIGEEHGEWLEEPTPSVGGIDYEFRGDNRGPGGNPDKSRLRVVVHIQIDEESGIVHCDQEVTTGVSHRRATAYIFGKMHQWERSDKSRPRETGPVVNGEGVSGSGAANYPFFGLSPDIDIGYHIDITRVRTVYEDSMCGWRIYRVTYRYRIMTDGFPDYEVLVNGGLVEGWSAPAGDGPTIGNLGGEGDVSHEGSGTADVSEPIIAPSDGIRVV